MSQKFIDVVTQPQILLAALFLAGVVFGVAVVWLGIGLSTRDQAGRRRPVGKGRLSIVPNLKSGPWSRKPEATPRWPTDAADQLRVVMAASFSPQPLLNNGEMRVFQELCTGVAARNPSWRVMAQVSLGEVLRCQNSEAYSCINSKRVDLLLVDENCHPRHVVEYQGKGHHQGTAAARDAVKKEALRRAGIGYHEVVAGQTTPSDLKRLVEKLVESPGIPVGRDRQVLTS